MERARDKRAHALPQGEKQTPQSEQTFVNPFSYESSPEARVQLELEVRGVRFSYRYFSDGGSAKHVHKLIPDFAPEFTLPDYKTVIMIEGDFYGSLPGAIDEHALAQVLLHADGWKGVIWLQSEITTLGVAVLLHRDLPNVYAATVKGPEIIGPYHRPLTMETRRQYLRGLALLRKLFGKATAGEAETDDRVRTRRFIRRVGRDGDRYRAWRQADSKNYE